MIRKRFIIFVNFIIFVIVGIFLLAGMSAPSDQSLISQFKNQAPHYMALVTMLQEDPKVGTIGDGFLFETGHPFISVDIAKLGITKERLAEYKRLLAMIKVMRLDRREQGDIMFLKWATGFGGDTSHKGIIWIVNSLPSGGKRNFFPIEKGWYIFQD